MSKSSKSLSSLTASLSLSSISRARSAAGVQYVLRSTSEVGGSCVVVRHTRPVSTTNRSNISNSHVRGGTSGRGEGRIRASSGSVAHSNSGTNSNVGSASLNGFFDPSSSVIAARSFHQTAYDAHQLAIAPSSSGISGYSPTTEASVEIVSSFQAKRPSPPPSPSPDQASPLTLSSRESDLSGAYASADSNNTPPSSSSSQTSLSNTTSKNASAADQATFFSSDPAASYSNTPLPSFFGTTLSIARRSNLVFRNGAHGIPKVKLGEVDKLDKGKQKLIADKEEVDHPLSVGIGEDAYFLRTDSLGVADGVGGWSGHAGANPARWSRKLMHHCAAELARYENIDDELFLQYYEIDPVDVLQRAFEKCLAECKEEGVIGSSTALLAVLRNDELRLANMGDCCCSIIRGSDYIFRSEEQQHSFNFPVQAGTNSRDTPIKDAQKFTVKVQKDDIVILSSDGLVDNLFDEDILEEVLRFVANNPISNQAIAASSPMHPNGSTEGLNGSPRFTLNRFSPQLVSEALCLRAKSVYEDQRAISSPFQQRAMEEGIHFAGGKRDDITALVGLIGELEASPDRR